jgi:hypothetical protein
MSLECFRFFDSGVIYKPNYFKYLGSFITNDKICTREIKIQDRHVESIIQPGGDAVHQQTGIELW